MKFDPVNIPFPTFVSAHALHTALMCEHFEAVEVAVQDGQALGGALEFFRTILDANSSARIAFQNARLAAFRGDLEEVEPYLRIVDRMMLLTDRFEVASFGWYADGFPPPLGAACRDLERLLGGLSSGADMLMLVMPDEDLRRLAASREVRPTRDIYLAYASR